MHAPGPGVPAGRLDERGMTLVEVVVVGVLAVIVMLALTGFYINSQGTWIEASSQAVTQREASLILQTLADSVHAASGASVNAGTKTVILLDAGGSEFCRFWLNSSDSLIHIGKGAGADFGPIATSVATRFDLSGDAQHVNVLALELRSASGRLVRMSTSAAFYNQ